MTYVLSKWIYEKKWAHKNAEKNLQLNVYKSLNVGGIFTPGSKYRSNEVFLEEENKQKAAWIDQKEQGRGQQKLKSKRFIE